MDELFIEDGQTAQNVDLGRYFRSIVKRWWLVLLVAAAVTMGYKLYLDRLPLIYEAEVWINFENMAGTIPEHLIQSRIAKLTSRTFAEEVTAKLGLTMTLESPLENKHPIVREKVFDSFATTLTPVTGRYRIRIDPYGMAVLYHESRRLDSLDVAVMIRDTVSYNNLKFSLASGIANQPTDITFTVRDFQTTVQSLVSRENVTSNQSGSLMKITLRDQYPVLASRTVNMLAGLFVQKSLDMGKESDRSVRQYLQEQLGLVTDELNTSDYQLKSFQDTHLMGLDKETTETVDKLNGLERRLNELTINQNELKLLLTKLDPNQTDFSGDVSVYYIFRQIAGLQVFSQDADMTVTRQQLSDLDRTKSELLKTYPGTNANIREISEKISFLEMKIIELANQKLNTLTNEIAGIKTDIQNKQGNLNRLPAETLRLVQLSRQQKVKEDIHGMLLKRFEEARINEAVASESVSILDPAIPPISPINGNKGKKLLMGLFGGFFLGIVSAIFWEKSDKTIKTHMDVKRYLNIAMMGAIPKVKFDDAQIPDSDKAKRISSQIVTHDYSPTPVGEAYRALRTNLLFSKSFGPLRSLVVCSISPGEGKSFTASNLAITMAQQKSKTLLIDADLRRGVLHNTFSTPKKPGLTNYLTGAAPFEAVLHETYVPNLSLISCGSMIPNPTELLGSAAMKRFIDGVTQRFDFVIFDTPPLLAATDAVILGTLANGVVLLIRSGMAKREVVQRKLELFQNVQAKVIGVVLNCVGVEVAHEGYSYYPY
jgi:polysaccharide biosynthesis transport protein